MNKSCKVKLISLVFLAFFALFLVTMAQANMKDDAMEILGRAGLLLDKDPTGCAVAELGQPTRLIKISCIGPDYEEYRIKAKKAFKIAGYTIINSGEGFIITTDVADSERMEPALYIQSEKVSVKILM